MWKMSGDKTCSFDILPFSLFDADIRWEKWRQMIRYDHRLIDIVINVVKMLSLPKC